METLIEAQRFLARHLFPGEQVIVGLTYAGEEVILSITVGGDKDTTGLGVTLEQAIHNLIALRRKKAEKLAQKAKAPQEPSQPLPDLRERVETR